MTLERRCVDEFLVSTRQSVPLLCAILLSSSPAFGQTPVPSEEAEGPETQTSDTSSADAAPIGDAEIPTTDAAPSSEEPAREDSPAQDTDDVMALATEEREPGPTGDPALVDTPEEASLEEEEGWLKWPFSKKNQSDPAQAEPHRWGSAGGFVGWVSRPSQSDSIKYRPGIVWGGYIRAELASWMGLRLFYREERIPVQVEPGAFDYEDDTYEDDFEQPDMEMLNLGGRLEPTLVVHPRVRVRGIVGWSWLWFRAPFPISDDFELERTFRSAVQMDFSFGAGLSLDIVENWIDISLDSAYSVPAGRTGTAYEPAQIVRDGAIGHIAPLPKLQNSLDCLISLGVIL